MACRLPADISEERPTGNGLRAASPLREVATLFTRLGFTAFGGPAAHLALMEDEVVTRRRWLDRAHFLDIVSAVNFIPGPNSTELAIHLGHLRAGFPGLLAAGVCFITPAVLIILPLAWLYVRFGTLPQAQPILRTISAAIVAVIAVATIRFLRTAIKDRFTAVLCILVAAGAGTAHAVTRFQPEVSALVFAAVCGALWYRRKASATLAGLTPAYVILLEAPTEYLRLGLFFLKVGATLFGSGYVLVSYLQSGLVDDYGWLTQQQLVDAVAVGQFTPGPLLTTATFAGYLVGHTTFNGGVAGGLGAAVLATIAIFLPSFVLVALLGPLLQKLRSSRIARGALDGMNAAVVALMVVVTVRLAAVTLVPSHTGTVDWINVLVMVAATAALLSKINATWIIVVAGVLGGLISMLS